MTDSAAIQEDFATFVAWALAQLGVDVADQGDGFYLATPSNPQATWPPAEFRYRIGPHGEEATDGAVVISPAGTFWQEMLRRLEQLDPAPQSAPDDEPSGVGALAEAIFAPYVIEGGKCQLGGCRLEERPLLRMTSIPADGLTVRHQFFWRTGEQLSGAEIDAFGLNHLSRRLAYTRDARANVQILLEQSHDRAMAAQVGDRMLATIVWCKYVIGKIDILIGDSVTSLPFEGWARHFVSGDISPPRFHCEATGRISYHLGVTDSGVIAPVESIATCELTGKCVLESDLETSTISGKRGCKDQFATCPVSNDRLLTTELQTCSGCGQKVSPKSLRGGVCLVCRSLRSISKDDPTMARILDVYPELDKWGSWRMAESHDAYVLRGGGWWNEIRLTLDMATLEPRLAEERTKVVGRWRPFPDVEWRRIFEK
ncbi:hypothetical protein LOC68_15640 [Blastopirellula sp. JC732]|uniref:Uncharacterized protein n=1 Tax=Blastopirellula sediminis TaxID=2894196 RepID=A0A9X1MP38_9BACT|nr:hypothetical protein [Blastopirellula sediminis]MCC9606882.1 hypothetical protein [Blastopirellula sediminis]MCC9629822.1 hypothetical protein [Blastopirellula sediminis]